MNDRWVNIATFLFLINLGMNAFIAFGAPLPDATGQPIGKQFGFDYSIYQVNDFESQANDLNLGTGQTGQNDSTAIETSGSYNAINLSNPFDPLSNNLEKMVLGFEQVMGFIGEQYPGLQPITGAIIMLALFLKIFVGLYYGTLLARGIAGLIR